MNFKEHQSLENHHQFRLEMGFEVIAILTNYFSDKRLGNMTSEWCMEQLRNRYCELLKEIK